VRVYADKIDKFDRGPITEAYDIELRPATTRRPQVSPRWRTECTRSTARVDRALRGGAEKIQILPVSPPTAEA
jgi:hypothetical protein